MGIATDALECSLMYAVLCVTFLLVPSAKYLEPFNVLGHVACAVLFVYVCALMATSETQIDSTSLIHCDWSTVLRVFGILLFSFVPVVQVGHAAPHGDDFFPPRLRFSPVRVFTPLHAAKTEIERCDVKITDTLFRRYSTYFLHYDDVPDDFVFESYTHM